MKECTVCLTNKTSYPQHCPENLENPNLCVDLITDKLLKKLVDKGYGIVYHSFSAKHPKINSETGESESEVKIEIVFDKIYDSSVFAGLVGSFHYYQNAYTPVFLRGKSPNFILNFVNPKRSVLLCKYFYNAEVVNIRQALVWLVEALCQWCDEQLKDGEHNGGL